MIFQQLIELDKDLLLAINGANAPFLDIFFMMISGKLMWIPTALIMLYVIIKTQHNALWVILAIVLAITMADQLSSTLIKPLVARLRPTHEPSLAGLVHVVNGYVGGKHGFVSSHAANSFAFALFTTLIFRNRLYAVLIFSWACLFSYSRMYLGVHYPLDIVGGIFVGCLSAIVAYLLLKKLKPSAIPTSKNTYALRDIYLIAVVLLLSVGGVALGNYFCFG